MTTGRTAATRVPRSSLTIPVRFAVAACYGVAAFVYLTLGPFALGAFGAAVLLAGLLSGSRAGLWLLPLTPVVFVYGVLTDPSGAGGPILAAVLGVYLGLAVPLGAGLVLSAILTRVRDRAQIAASKR